MAQVSLKGLCPMRDARVTSLPPGIQLPPHCRFLLQEIFTKADFTKPAALKSLAEDVPNPPA